MSSDADPLNLSDERLAAWEGFLRAYSTVTRTLGAELEHAEGLSLSSYDALIQLARAPQRRMRMAELAEVVILTPSGLTRLVERLEREGLVARARCAEDRRGAYATLTDRGRRRLRKATLTHLAGVRQHFLGHLDDAELRLLAGIWKRIPAAASEPPESTKAVEAGPPTDRVRGRN